MVGQLSDAVENASMQMDSLADLIQQANDEEEAAEKLMELMNRINQFKV